MLDSHTRGELAESIAARYLMRQGLRLIQRNFRCRCGEIDLIMQHDTTLVFVEVRLRHSNSHGSAAESITSTKQRHLINTARYYLQGPGRPWRHAACRFDVVLQTASHKIDWIKNAFEVQY